MTCTCGTPMVRLWDPPAKHKVDFIAGYDAGLGEHFSSARQRDEFIARDGNIRRIKD